MSDGQDVDSDADEDYGVGLPKGSKNYLTPGGYRAMLDELEYLWRTERPKVRCPEPGIEFGRELG